MTHYWPSFSTHLVCVENGNTLNVGYPSCPGFLICLLSSFGRSPCSPSWTRSLGSTLFPSHSTRLDSQFPRWGPFTVVLPSCSSFLVTGTPSPLLILFRFHCPWVSRPTLCSCLVLRACHSSDTNRVLFTLQELYELSLLLFLPLCLSVLV